MEQLAFGCGGAGLKSTTCQGSTLAPSPTLSLPHLVSGGIPGVCLVGQEHIGLTTEAGLTSAHLSTLPVVEARLPEL